MIFDNLFQIWRKNDLMAQAVEDSHEMIEEAFNSYIIAKKLLLEDNGCDLEEIKKKDYLLNHFERSVRKKVFEHYQKDIDKLCTFNEGKQIVYLVNQIRSQPRK